MCRMNLGGRQGLLKKAKLGRKCRTCGKGLLKSDADRCQCRLNQSKAKKADIPEKVATRKSPRKLANKSGVENKPAKAVKKSVSKSE